MAEQPKKPESSDESPVAEESPVESAPAEEISESDAAESAEVKQDGAEELPDKSEKEAPGEHEPAEASQSARLPALGVGANTNTRLMLLATSAIFATTFLSWGAGKVTCNHHPPHYKKIKPAPIERLLGTAKDAALEFHHRVNTGEFDLAREAATDKGRALLASLEEACDAPCRKERLTRRDLVATRATVNAQDHSGATATAESFRDGKTTSETYKVVRDGRLWKVDGRAE